MSITHYPESEAMNPHGDFWKTFINKLNYCKPTQRLARFGDSAGEVAHELKPANVGLMPHALLFLEWMKMEPTSPFDPEIALQLLGPLMMPPFVSKPERNSETGEYELNIAGQELAIGSEDYLPGIGKIYTDKYCIGKGATYQDAVKQAWDAIIQTQGKARSEGNEVNSAWEILGERVVDCLDDVNKHSTLNSIKSDEERSIVDINRLAYVQARRLEFVYRQLNDDLHAIREKPPFIFDQEELDRHKKGRHFCVSLHAYYHERADQARARLEQSQCTELSVYQRQEKRVIDLQKSSENTWEGASDCVVAFRRLIMPAPPTSSSQDRDSSTVAGDSVKVGP